MQSAYLRRAVGESDLGRLLHAVDEHPPKRFKLGLRESPTVPTESPRPVITDPQVALDRLMAGNQRFVDAQMQHPDQDPEHRLKLSQGQQPFATILTCSDSRLPPELLFDQGLGDLFVARVAGNIVDPALLGSVEYAVGHLGTPLIVVIGHEKCGAVEATLESIQHHQTPHGDIAALVTAITPAVAVAEQRPRGGFHAGRRDHPTPNCGSSPYSGAAFLPRNVRLIHPCCSPQPGAEPDEASNSLSGHYNKGPLGYQTPASYASACTHR